MKFTLAPANPPYCPEYPLLTTVASCTSLLPRVKFVAPELFTFRNGSLSYIPSRVNRLEVADTPKLEKLPNPIPVFITDPAAVWATKVRSLPGLGTSDISRALNVVETSEDSVCRSGDSPETSTVVP